jgi:hypothetical protein
VSSKNQLNDINKRMHYVLIEEEIEFKDKYTRVYDGCVYDYKFKQGYTTFDYDVIESFDSLEKAREELSKYKSRVNEQCITEYYIEEREEEFDENNDVIDVITSSITDFSQWDIEDVKSMFPSEYYIKYNNKIICSYNRFTFEEIKEYIIRELAEKDDNYGDFIVGCKIEEMKKIEELENYLKSENITEYAFELIDYDFDR